MALLLIPVVALALGLAGVRSSKETYLAMTVLTLGVGWYAFTR